MLYTDIRYIPKEDRKRTIERLILLRRQLDEEIPEKTAANTLLLATWNIREFKDNRRKESLFYIAEIISRFDLVAVQEVARDKTGLEKVMKLLGKNWDYIATDSTEGVAGGGECMAFLYDTNKVHFKNMAGEIVLPDKKGIKSLQFARTPFCVSFQAGWFKFNLATVHIYYGTDEKVNERRLYEIQSLSKAMSARAKKEKFNYVVRGDFNIPDIDCDYMKALESNGFHIPNAIKEHPTDLGGTYHYDQIAFNMKTNDLMTVYNEKQQKSGAFNFTKSVFREEDEAVYTPYFDRETIDETLEKARVKKENKEKKKAKEQSLAVELTEEEKAEIVTNYYLKTYRTFEMSDHLPLWVQMKVDYSAKYLEDRLKEA